MTITRRTPSLLALAGAALALLIGAGVAAGGGFATTTLDPLVSQPRAGETTEVGYTIRTHGVRPVAVAGSGIAIVGPDGERTVFPGRADGPVGPPSDRWPRRAVETSFEYLSEALDPSEATAPRATRTAATSTDGHICNSRGTDPITGAAPSRSSPEKRLHQEGQVCSRGSYGAQSKKARPTGRPEDQPDRARSAAVGEGASAGRSVHRPSVSLSRWGPPMTLSPGGAPALRLASGDWRAR
jgi:hypothetical protein